MDENRRRLCAEIGADSERLALNRQVHSALVHRAVAGARGEPGDGLWTDEPGLPVLAMTADCLPIALVRTNGDAPAVAVVHAGWRGLLAGIVGVAVETLGDGVRACVGPAIGPCCYEVGSEVAEPFAEAFGERRPSRPQPRSLDRGGAGARARRASSRSSASTSARRATPTSSSRTAAPASRGASRAWSRVSPEAVRAAYTALRDEVGAGVTVVVATKYVPLEDMGVLAEAGRRGRRREPGAGSRAQARRVRRRLPLALHRAPPVQQGEDREPDVRARALARLRLHRAAADGARARRGEPRAARRRSRVSHPTSSAPSCASTRAREGS